MGGIISKGLVKGLLVVLFLCVIGGIIIYFTLTKNSKIEDSLQKEIELKEGLVLGESEIPVIIELDSIHNSDKVIPSGKIDNRMNLIDSISCVLTVSEIKRVSKNKHVVRIYLDDEVNIRDGFVEQYRKKEIQGYEDDRFYKGENVDFSDGDNWFFSQINAGKKDMNSGEGVKVCIIDSGVSDNPKFLKPLINEIDLYYNDNDADDSHSSVPHGTAVASIIASQDDMYPGVSPGVDLMAVKVFPDKDEEYYEYSMSTFTSLVLKGIEWCYEHNADVISMSIGSGNYPDYPCDDQILAKMVNKVSEKDVIVVVSAGNEGEYSYGLINPACASESLTAGALSESGESVVFWSTFGPGFDKKGMLTPGENVVVFSPDGGKEVWSGTSFSAPIMAGSVSLLKYSNPSSTSKEIKKSLLSTGERVDKCQRYVFWTGDDILPKYSRRVEEVSCNSWSRAPSELLFWKLICEDYGQMCDVVENWNPEWDNQWKSTCPVDEHTGKGKVDLLKACDKLDGDCSFLECPIIRCIRRDSRFGFCRHSTDLCKRYGLYEKKSDELDEEPSTTTTTIKEQEYDCSKHSYWSRCIRDSKCKWDGDLRIGKCVPK